MIGLVLAGRALDLYYLFCEHDLLFDFPIHYNIKKIVWGQIKFQNIQKFMIL